MKLQETLALYKSFTTLWFFSLADLTMPDAEDEDEIEEDHKRKEGSLALYKWFNTLWFSVPDLTMPDAEDEDEIDEDHERLV
jgi:hypothetical protein